jgi:hypothetical protein
MDDELGIFETQDEAPQQNAAVRGTGAVAGLAVVIAVVVLLVLAVFMAVGMSLARMFEPTRVEVVTLEHPSCTVISEREFLITSTIGTGPDYESSFFVGLHGWSPDGVYFRNPVTGDAESLAPGDPVTFGGPVARADDILGVEMDIWRGEPGYAQTIPLRVQISGDRCRVSGE